MAYLTYDDFDVEDGYIYVIKVMGYCKIGKTKNFEKRFGEYTMLMEEPEILLLDYVSDYHRMELDLHKAFEHKRARGEWFKLSERDIEHIDFMLSSYHVKNEEDQMNELIDYLSNMFHIKLVWMKNDDKYMICKIEGKAKIPAFPTIRDCKSVKEIQVEILRCLSEDEKRYQIAIDDKILTELVKEVTNSEEQAS